MIDRVRLEFFDHGTPVVHERDRANDDGRPVRASIVTDDQVYEVMVIEDEDGQTKIALREGAGWSDAIPLPTLAKALRPKVL